MAGRIEARLTELKIELPQPGTPLANYVPFVRSGDLLFIAGQVCQWNGERRFIGKLGREVSLEQGQQAARLCGLNILAVAKRARRRSRPRPALRAPGRLRQLGR
jgi:enamine deaminase RidA (YjgF/YER057c/UK114 family)